MPKSEEDAKKEQSEIWDRIHNAVSSESIQRLKNFQLANAERMPDLSATLSAQASRCGRKLSDAEVVQVLGAVTSQNTSARVEFKRQALFDNGSDDELNALMNM